MRIDALLTTLASVTLLLTLSGCVEAEDNSTDVSISAPALAALKDYREFERETFASGDVRLIDRFSDDMILMSNGVPTLSGREALRTHFKSVWQTHTTQIGSLVDEDIVEIGDLLIVSGRFQLHVVEKGAEEAATSDGRYLAIFRKNAEGEYMLWREAALDGG